ncbi:MAG TPA: DUF4870 domain-containing protein [Flavobacteriaceae bacterium]|nr:DUF4870 domain-containing protein [Flavobacteriaceae bacterium]
METHISNQNKNIGTLIHASTFSKYFFPFGNFIFPLVFWLSNKNKAFIDAHGKQCLNFQISVTLYAVILATLGFFGTIFSLLSSNSENIRQSFDPLNFQYLSEVMPFFIFLGIMATLFIALFIFEIICVLQASVRASEGKAYNYPICIHFIQQNSSKNEWPTTLKTETL